MYYLKHIAVLTNRLPCLRCRNKSRSGQAVVEYIIIAGMLTATLAILIVFLATFREHGGRVMDLAGSEYP